MRATLAYLPSPSQGVWLHGAVKAYALCIVLGIVVAVWMGERRWVARGGQRGTVSDVAIRAVVFGLIGGRLYHVITDWELYFGAGRHPIDALKVWNGGLGIWGAIALGALGAWLGCRAEKIPFRAYADAVIPGVAIAQAIGRWGNWFNQELFGRPTTLPWGLKIDPGRPDTVPGAQAYHPTFLYESLWDLGLAGVLIWADRRFTLGRGRVFALYIMGYPLGRIWIEALRIDNAHHILGLRLNIWTSILVFLGGLAMLLLSKGPREVLTTPGGAEVEAAGTVAVDDGEDDEAEVGGGADEAEVGGADEADGGEADTEDGAVDATAVDAEDGAVDTEAVDDDDEAVDAEGGTADGTRAVATEAAAPAVPGEPDAAPDSGAEAVADGTGDTAVGEAPAAAGRGARSGKGTSRRR